jgi:hypothetical protein
MPAAMRLCGASRRDLFERLDQLALRPLPAERFVYGEWIKARVNIDYHVEVQTSLLLECDAPFDSAKRFGYKCVTN